MARSLKLSGDALTGAWDSELTAASPSIVAALIGSTRWYRVTSSAATKIIGRSPLGSPATTYFGFAFRKTGNPASSQVFLHPFTSGGATAFRLRLSSTGTIILDGASTNGLDTSAALANDTTYALVGQVSATAATVTIYAADGTTVIDTITATNTFGLVDNWRMGQIGGSPALPDWYFRMLLVGDTAVSAAEVLAVPSTPTGPAVAVLGDSNTFENGAGPTHYFDAFTAAGIDTGNVYYGGVGGKRIAAADLTGKTAANNVADAQTWLGSIDTWMIALGTNDRPQPDATINADIDTLLAAIGTGPKIIWIGLTSKAAASTDDIRVNNLIRAKLTARGKAEFADWDAAIRAIDGGANPSPYWIPTDSTHMSPEGYAEAATFRAAQLVEGIERSGTVPLTVTLAATRSVDTARSAPLGVTVEFIGSRAVDVRRAGVLSLTLQLAGASRTDTVRGASLTLNVTPTASAVADTARGGVLSLETELIAVAESGTIHRDGVLTLSITQAAEPTSDVARLGVLGLALDLKGVTAGIVIVVPDVLTLAEVPDEHALTPIPARFTLEDA